MIALANIGGREARCAREYHGINGDISNTDVVEQATQTLQDRLIKAMRLECISGIARAVDRRQRPPGAPPLRREAAKKEEEKTSDPPYQPRQKPLGSLSLRNLGAGGAKVAPIAAHLVGSAHGAPSGAKLHAVTSL